MDDLTFYVQTLNDGQFIQVAVAALVFYEYIITLSQEVQFIWKRKFSLGSILFFVNRYISLLNAGASISMPLMTNSTEKGAEESQSISMRVTLFSQLCNDMWRLNEASIILIHMVIAVLSSIRLYAIWNGNRRLSILTLCFGMIYPVVLLYYDTKLVFAAFPPPFGLGMGCTAASKFVNPTSDFTFFVFGLISVLLFEAYVVVCTWIRALGFRRYLYKASVKTPLTSLIARDGTVYFVALSILTAIELLALRYGASVYNLGRRILVDNIGSLIPMIMSIFVSRFMFHLRETYMAASSSELNTTDFPNITSTRHSRSWVVGNLGAALDFSDEQEREIDEASEVQEWDGTCERLETPVVSHNPLWHDLAAEMERLPPDV